MRVVSLKINPNVYPLKNTNPHYLLFNTTIIPPYKGKISLIFFCEGCNKKVCALVDMDLLLMVRC